jgi:hypothetical protein
MLSCPLKGDGVLKWFEESWRSKEATLLCPVLKFSSPGQKQVSSEQGRLGAMEHEGA